MFLPTALAVLAATASAQYIPIIVVPPDDENSHHFSPKVGGIILGCIFGLLFLGCFGEAIWRKLKPRRQAQRQPDPEQPAQDSVPAAPLTAPNLDSKDEDSKESGNIHGIQDSVDTDSIFMVPVCPPPPAYTPKTDKIYKPLGGGEW
ncbi:hypothetical protein EV421DRAFT_1006649 [Armillaria borealis]|uniref:Uncharacterized protein n=1 Tax=Armillaria borealis TaxID=47425 RepID=A0AA39MKI0_9AGAR|nr:hypothetical protein EV421DRAFT_1006649 [Armillaria borealis]